MAVASTAAPRRSTFIRRNAIWWVALVLVVLLPQVARSGTAIAVLNQMCIMVIFSLSYNMLLGQGGMLSFGHAVYFGLGGYFAMHLIKMAGGAGFFMPLPLVPLAGGLAGLFFGLLFGSFSTNRAGTVFAMISLGIGEMIAASSLIFVKFSGGEEGITADRTDLTPFFGYRFGSELEVYYLIAGWMMLSAWLMYRFSRTPLGRMANAVRDNPERAEFVGYSQRRVRLLSFMAAGFFAGIAGGLFALNYEIVTEETVNLVTSGIVLLQAYIGGVGFFAGPIVGAVVYTLLQTLLSNYTEIWAFYVGVCTHRADRHHHDAFSDLPRAQAAHARAAVPQGRRARAVLCNRGDRATRAAALPQRARGRSVYETPVLDEPQRRAADGLDRFRRARGGRVPPRTAHGAGAGRGLGGGERADARGTRAVSAAIELIDLYKSFGSTEVIRGVNLAVEQGERHAIIGPNGAGKSTLYNLITTKYVPTAGRIRLRGEDVTGRPPFEINRMGLSRSFQVTNIFPRMSVFENVRCGTLWAMNYRYSFWHDVDRLDEVNERSLRVLNDIGMAARAEVPAGVLSYAEQRALEIGITIAGGADIILLDEPTAGMNRSETAQTVDLVRRITENKTLVMVEHDMSVVFGLADRITVLVYGEVIASGPPDEIRGNPAVREAYLGEAVD